MSSARTILPVSIVSISSATDTTLVAAQPGHRVLAWQLALQNTHAATDVTLTFKSNAGGTAISGAYLLKAGGGAITLQFTDLAWFGTAKGEALTITTSAAGVIVGTVNYSIEPVG